MLDLVECRMFATLYANIVQTISAFYAAVIGHPIHVVSFTPSGRSQGWIVPEDMGRDQDAVPITIYAQQDMCHYDACILVDKVRPMIASCMCCCYNYRMCYSMVRQYLVLHYCD